MLSKKMVGLFKSYTIHGFVPLLCVQAVESTLSDKKKEKQEKSFSQKAVISAIYNTSHFIAHLTNLHWHNMKFSSSLSNGCSAECAYSNSYSLQKLLENHEILKRNKPNERK